MWKDIDFHHVKEKRMLSLTNRPYRRLIALLFPLIFTFSHAQTGKFLIVTDVHLQSDTVNVTYGSDAGTAIWNAALNKFSQILKSQQPEFVLYLGDLTRHSKDWWGSCPPSIRDSADIHDGIEDVLEGLRTHAEQGGVPLLYLPGNNDGYMGDYSSFTYIDPSQDSITPFDLDPAGEPEWPVINPSTGKTATYIRGDRDLGFYSAYPIKGNKKLRIIMLNTVIFSNSSIPYCQFDGVDQQAAATDLLDFLVAELKDAQTKQEKVYLAMHIPPGYDSWSKKPNWRPSLTYSLGGQTATVEETFQKLLVRHQKDIAGILTAHTHLDEMKRYFQGNRVIEISIGAPGISVDHSNNPGMKLVEYRTKDYELMDFQTYYASPVGSSAGISITDWSNNPYTFDSIYGPTNGKPMLNRIQSMSHRTYRHTGMGFMNQTTIANKMRKYTMVKSGQSNGYKHDCALDVGGKSDCQ